jgi:predicted amidohydrolase YtcJ
MLSLTAIAGGCAGPVAPQGESSLSATEPADLIVVNARVWTGNAAQPAATAFAVRDGRFICIGDNQTARGRLGPKTKLVDAGGRRIVPGFIDAHVHLVQGGLNLSRLNLHAVADRDEFIKAVGDRANRLGKNAWILGGRWSTESWPDPAQPTKQWIDQATANNPVLLHRMDGHEALVNSVALRIAGIDRSGPADPPGGKIERNASTGEPTGILKESAIDLVSAHVPPPSAEELRRGLAAATEEAHSHGVTTVHTMSAWNELATLDEARAAGELSLRVRFFVSEDNWLDYLDRAKAHAGDDWLRIRGFKQFTDGSLGSRTAYMARPYSDNPPDKPDWRGMLSAIAEKEGYLLRQCQGVDAAGFTPAVHAIGDQANRLLLDIYAETAKANGPRPGRRMRIEHAQHLLPEDVGRFAPLGVVASMQPLHKADDGRYAEKAIGAERCRSSYAYGILLDSGALVAFGSDWPVVSLDPLEGIAAATSGRTIEGQLFVPEQSITAEEALRAYTTGGAAAGGDDDLLGRIAPGFLADFVILSGDVLPPAPAKPTAARVDETYAAGKRLWPH